MSNLRVPNGSACLIFPGETSVCPMPPRPGAVRAGEIPYCCWVWDRGNLRICPFLLGQWQFTGWNLLALPAHCRLRGDMRALRLVRRCPPNGAR